MRFGRFLAPAIGATLVVCALYAQRPFRQYPAWEYYNFPLPEDWNQPGEWVFARLMYPTTSIRLDWQSEWRRGFDWREGNTNWTIDYPRSDRHLSAAVRRLTRINARSVEQPINLDDELNDVFNYPWLYAVEVGHWELTDEQIAKFREYLLRGGFFMCDDFHGTNEWEVFQYTMQKVLPGKQIVDIPDGDAIFHTVFDLDERYQVPGAQYLNSGRVYEKDGYQAKWRGIYDDNGRLLVAICHNVDLGDSWENADDPRYPEKFSALGIRIGVNYIIYSMTH
jgi:Domain of unknown function (DUF4159)